MSASDPATLFGAYRLLSLLGEGAMGQVYLAEDTRTGAQVALKLMRETDERAEENLARFIQEGEALRQLNHPNIVKMLEVLQVGEQQAIILEYMSGGSLRDWLDHSPQLPLGTALKIALELADALSRAHHLKIIHRDIKPGNILLAPDGSPRLTDFGIARFSEQTHELTQTGVLIGSFSYLSPEALNGDKASLAQDLWAFGVVLYEMLAGQRPFSGESLTSTVAAILSKEAPPIGDYRPDLPPPLSDLLARLLAKDPAARPSSARQIGAELERIAAQAGITPEIHTPPPLKDQAALGSELASRPRLASSTKVPNPTHKLSAAQKYAAAPRPTWLLPAFILLFSLGAILLLFLLLQVLAEDASPDEGGAREEVLIVRDPAATGEMAILVAQMAPLGEARPSVDRLILENLQQTLEGGAPELRLRVIPYPAVVSSEAQAAQIASANRAQMLIWGDYNEEFIEARLQVYAPQDRPAMQAAWLADMTHGRFRLYDERSDSLAAPVLAGLSHLYEYLGSPAATVMILSINAELNLAWPEVVGVDIGANVYRYHAAGLDSPAARAPLAEALRLDPRNPLLYYTQAIYERSQGQTAAMEAKLESAMRLSEEQWAMPYILRAQIALQTDDYPQAEAHLQEVLRIQPEDWYAHYSLGLIAYAQGERAAAKPHFRASAKDNTPFTITPNMFLALIALEEGQIEDFRLTSQAAMAEYGDPNTIRRVNRFFVDEAGLAATLMQNVFSVFANLVLGQHRAAGQDAVALILQQPDNPVFYLLAGVAACLDEDWPAAITAYNQSIALDGQNGFYYLLRGEAHRAQGDIGAALEDLSAAQAAPNWDSLAPAVNLDDPTPACERLSMLGDS